MSSRKNYSREFKEEAVQLAQKNGNQTQTAQDLGIHLSVLRRWKKELEIDGQQADLRCSGWAGPFREKAIQRMKNFACCKKKINA